MREPKVIAAELQERISKSRKILIISSRAPDEDCLACNVVLRWWINQMYPEVNVDSVIFSDIFRREKLRKLPKEVNQISSIQATDFEPEKYDLIINVDGNSWDRVFTIDSALKLKNKLNLQNFYQIDHHFANTVAKDVPDNSIQLEDCCCSKLIYDFFIEPSGVQLTPEIATWMYYALIDDTGRFVHEVYKDTYKFAQILHEAGADHDRVVDESMTYDEMNFMVWAIEHTDFDLEIKTTILVIDQQRNDELDELFGSDWSFRELYREGYTEKIKRKILGFDYGITFSERRDGTITASWRTRNYGTNISIEEVLMTIGFEQAGGHFGAGGGHTRIMTMKQVIEKFKEEMRARFAK